MTIYLKLNKTLCLGGCLLGLAFASFGQNADSTLAALPEALLENTDDSFQLGDTIDLGFNKKSKREVVGAVSAIRPDSYLGYDNTQVVRDALLGRVAGVYGSDNIRGLGGALIVVDGIPGRPIDLLNAEEIEQITVLKDANAVAQYGTMGINGVIVVTTKRGDARYRRANVTASYGVSRPVDLPNYLGSADYMQLFNEARLNDGLDSAFSQEIINNFRSGDNPYRYPNVDYFSQEYLNPSVSFVNAVAEFSGGSENTQYYINMGYNNSSSLLRLNPEANAGSHRFNIRGNINFRVNDFITSSLDVVSMVSTQKTARGDWFQEGTIRRPFTFAPLLPVSLVDTVGNPALAGQVAAANLYGGNLLGGAQAFQNNTPIADALAGGYQEFITRITQVNNAIDFDLDRFVKGLSAKTYVSFDFYNIYSQSVNNSYSVYEPTWSGDTIVALNRIGEQDLRDLTENVNTQNFLTRYGFYGMLNYDKQLAEKHRINASLIGYANNTYLQNQTQPQKNAHVALQLNYNFDNKLLLDFSSAYVNSVKLPEGNRGAFSPSAGIAYVLSEENFLGEASWLDYLKIRATAGIINSDVRITADNLNLGESVSDYFLYREIYAQDGPSYGWADGFNNQATRIQQGPNPNFGFEQRKDINLGFEGLLFGSLWVEMNAFRTDIDNQVTRLTTQYPSFYGDFTPYSNYNSTRIQGVEMGVQLSEQIGQVGIGIGVRATYAETERLRVDEVYEDSYQFRQGRPADAMWGLEDLGFYTAADFTEDGSLREGLPQSAFGSVRPGDIRYQDQNNDGTIDNRDQVVIGRWFAPWTFSTDLRLEYKGLTLFVLGVSQVGNQALRNNNYFWVDGNDKYSEVVLDRWTEETATTATYPRLSSQQSNNNFQNSTFWMYDNSYFTIQRTQLTYQLPSTWVGKLNMANISIYVAGNNLLEIAENRDIRQLRIGSEPMYRSYSAGLRASF